MAGTSEKNHYIVILCGGTGPRLWPLSRATNPKQFLHLFEPKSLLEQTINRALKITSKENIYIISNQIYLKKIKEITKNLISSKNIISEPLKKNTALAIIYASALIKNQNPNAVVSSMPSDHYIKNINKFKNDLIKAKKLAKKYKSIITLGIKPYRPDTSYGYIVPKEKDGTFQKVSKFIEKPEVSIAKKLIKQSAYWNSGIYTFSLSTLESELKLLDQDYYQAFLDLSNNIDSPKKITDIYLNSQELAFDRVISEKSKNMLNLSLTSDWNDVGEWETIFQSLPKDKNNIATIGTENNYSQINSNNCLVKTAKNKLIGLVGVENFAIIDTEDALLVCNMDNNGSYQVRDLISQIVKDKKLEDYFLKTSQK
jgi:mannose-1-phosphate guanylyltransferase